MNSDNALGRDTPINKMIKKMYQCFEAEQSIFQLLCTLNDEHWEEFKRFLSTEKNFYHIAFSCWHWSCDKEWISKDELVYIMTEFDNLIHTVELGRSGRIVEKNPSPGWNMDVEFIIK